MAFEATEVCFPFWCISSPQNATAARPTLCIYDAPFKTFGLEGVVRTALNISQRERLCVSVACYNVSICMTLFEWKWYFQYSKLCYGEKSPAASAVAHLPSIVVSAIPVSSPAGKRPLSRRAEMGPYHTVRFIYKAVFSVA
jgi:hypothetical protein